MAERDTRQLIGILEAQVNETDSTVELTGSQRERNHRYYTLQPLGNEQRGHSQYISPDVFDVVEAKKAHLTEVFFTGRQPVRVRATAFGTQAEADHKTAYANDVLKRNDWYSICQDGWHDAFVAKRMVLLAEWSPEQTTERAEVQGLTDIAMSAAMKQNPRLLDVLPVSGETTQAVMGGAAVPAFTGTIEQVLDDSRVRLTLIQPERYGRDGNVTYVKDAMFAYFSEQVSRADLIKRGFDPDQVSALAQDYDFRRNEEDSARKAHDASWNRNRMYNRPRETQTVEYFRTWAWLDMSDVNGTESDTINPDGLGLFEIHWCNGEILRYADGNEAIHEAPEMPFLEWTEYKISHAETGLATADVVAHTQKTNSTLKRLVVDNQQRSNTSRHVVRSGALKNPRELFDNKVGGTIFSKVDPSRAVMPLPPAPLSPLTMSAIEMLDSDKEERSGVSRLSQGLNTDVVRYQNAADMVERLTNNANKRISRSARSFAEFTGSVLAMVCRLASANDRHGYPMEVAGQQVMVQPSAWQAHGTGYTVDAALTPDEGLKRAQTLLMMDAQMMGKIAAGAQTGDMTWTLIYGPQQQHKLYDDVFDALGVQDTAEYMARPDDPMVQQAVAQQQQMQQMMQQYQMQQQQAQMMLAGKAIEAQTVKEHAEALYKQAQVMDMAQDNQRSDEELVLKRDEFEHKEQVDKAELALEAKQGNEVARSTNVA